MIFFRRKVRHAVEKKAEEAEVLKADIIESPKQVGREVDKLNKLIRSNGFALKISIGMGGRHD